MARQNKRGLELSFKRSGEGTRGRWYTRVGGKPIYFGWGEGISDRESYQTALASYRTWEDQQRELRKAQSRGVVPEGFATWKELEGAYAKWGAATAAENKASEGKGDKTTTVSALVDAWMADQRKRNERRHWVEQQRKEGKTIVEGKRENLSDGRYQSYSEGSEHIKATIGDMKWNGTEAACAEALKKYREECDKLLRAGKYSSNTFNGRMQTIRAWVTWLDENYKLDRLPRAIQKLTSKFAYEASAKAMPVEVIRTIWGAADDVEKAYIALALNCGYYAKDIAVLQADDIQDGRIIRNRNKTGVPTNYPLWKVTKELISSNGNKDGVVFLGKNGNPLVYHTDTGEKKFRVDAIADRFDRLLRELQKSKKLTAAEADYSFSNLRDTSTTFIEDNDPTFSDQFDAHGDKRMARFYVDPAALKTRQAKFDKLVAKLEQFYNLEGQQKATRKK